MRKLVDERAIACRLVAAVPEVHGEDNLLVTDVDVRERIALTVREQTVDVYCVGVPFRKQRVELLVVCEVRCRTVRHFAMFLYKRQPAVHIIILICPARPVFKKYIRFLRNIYMVLELSQFVITDTDTLSVSLELLQ